MNKLIRTLRICCLSIVVSGGVSGCSNDQERSSSAETGQFNAGEPLVSSQAKQVKPHGAADPHMNLEPEQYAMVALGHLDEGRIEEAYGSVNRAISLHPNAGNLFAVRAQIHSHSGQQSEALADLEKAVTLDSQNPNHYVNRATVYSKFDRDDQAMADLNHAITLNPDLLAARFNRGSLRFIQEDHQGALEDFEHCIALDPHTAAPYFNRAAVYDAIGDRNQAVSDLERFLQLAQASSWKDTAQNLLDRWRQENQTVEESDS